MAAPIEAVRPVLRALPWVLRARRSTRRTVDVHRLLADHDVAPKRSTGPPVESVRRGVDRALRLVGPRDDACVPRSLAMFALLSEQGRPAVFVSGIQRGESGLLSHAWVLVDGVPIGEPEAVRGYREQFRYANAAERRRSGAENPTRLA